MQHEDDTKKCRAGRERIYIHTYGPGKDYILCDDDEMKGFPRKDILLFSLYIFLFRIKWKFYKVERWQEIEIYCFLQSIFVCV